MKGFTRKPQLFSNPYYSFKMNTLFCMISPPREACVRAKRMDQGSKEKISKGIRRSGYNHALIFSGDYYRTDYWLKPSSYICLPHFSGHEKAGYILSL